ncbi:HD domain-containing protein [Patescibacteria group bacterium]
MQKTSKLTVDQRRILAETEEYIKRKLMGEGSGHDWWHIKRVQQIVVRIAKEEQADLFIVQLGALLHDISDWKFDKAKSTKSGMLLAKKWLEDHGVDNKVVEKVCDIVENASFKGAGVTDKLGSLEGRVVQDADRLDAVGAIGVGRTFAYGGYKNREMYNPDVKVKMAKTFSEYKKAGQTTINHFYEKLLLIKDRMNTKTGKKIAKHRHEFMQQFLQEFFAEWEGKK